MKGTLRITPRKDKTKITGKAPLRLTYSVQGQRKVINSDIEVFPFLWDYKDQRVLYVTKRDAKKIATEISYDFFPNENDVKELNQSITDIELAFTEIEKQILKENKLIAGELVAERYKSLITPVTVREAPASLVFDYIDKYIMENEPSRAKGSLQVYKTLKKHLNNYQVTTRRKVRFDKIGYSFMQSFQNYLIDWKEVNPTTERINTLNNITIAKQLSTLKTFLNYAKREGIEVKGNYDEFRIKRQKLEVIALTEREFQSLYKMDLSKDLRLAKVRDLFCFSCVTGLRDSDLRQLKHDHIRKTEIRITVTKTKEPLRIPLNQYSLAILAKYQDQQRPLPQISNQRLNEYVKELCKLAEINDPVEVIRFKGAEKVTTMHPKHELISIHNGRKTFATLSLEKGMNAETVMKIGGWSDYRSFSRYVNITENVKRNAMNEAWGKPEIMKVMKGGGE